jgi:outer membrane protein OmpA-like peptidoglycan-associated protein
VRLLATILILAPGLAAADDGWLVTEAPAAIATSDAQAGVFRPGIMPAIGLYAQNHHYAIGARLRAGILRDGAAPGDHLKDPGTGGLATLGLAFRLPIGPVWAEAVAGGGITGSDFVPAFEAGIGYALAVGDIDIGPSVRYVRLVKHDPMATLGSADLALVGIDVRFGKARKQRARVHVAAPLPPPPQMIDRDADRIVEREASCIADSAGCPAPSEPAAEIVIVDDRIVLDERVLFDLDRARVRSHGRELIEQIVWLWKLTSDWQGLTIEGHADERGTDEHNLELSQRRAERVRDVMVKLGCDPATIQAIGYGRSRPRAPGHTDADHQKNRRVEFVIDRKRELVGGAP